MTSATGDPLPPADAKAVQVAEMLRAEADSDLIILFGSRASGEYDEPRSDIDILLLQENEPDQAGKEALRKAAQAAAEAIYGRFVEAQPVDET